ncbi:MAG: DUF4876 domain-containing protein, partial [Candidatus Krumholzibacteriales bacterium]
MMSERKNGIIRINRQSSCNSSFKAVSYLILGVCFSLLAVISAGCGEDMPNIPDGEGHLEVMVADTSGFIGGGGDELYSVFDAEVHLSARGHEYNLISFTGIDGRVSFSNLPTGDYAIFATTTITPDLGESDKVFTGGGEYRVLGDESVRDTVLLSLIKSSDLMINEIFYCGSDNSSFYFYGQFCELYNASSDTMYLDGMLITRQRPVEADVEDPPLDYVRAIYAYQFPGTPVTGKEYPIAPGELIVIAADAMDHSMWAENSVDLSDADWETFNAQKYDWDNPDVPNLDAVNPDRGPDWMINLSHDSIVLATGENWYLEEYVQSSGYPSVQIVIPLDDVIDGVEYASHPEVTKELTRRVDAGFAGLGISKYSAQSTERRQLGLDTNDST